MSKNKETGGLVSYLIFKKLVINNFDNVKINAISKAEVS